VIWLLTQCFKLISFLHILLIIVVTCNKQLIVIYYLHQGAYVFVVVCLLATFHKNFQTDLHEIFRQGLQLAYEQTIKSCGDPDHGSGSTLQHR